MKNIIISGSSGIIGSTLKRRLEYDGHCVSGLDINHPTNPVDALDEKQVANFMEGEGGFYGEASVLINCLGIPDSSDSLEFSSLNEVTLESFEKYVDINLNATFVVIKEAVKAVPWIKNIVNISSLYSVVSPRTDLYGDSIKHPGYVASKFALVGLSQYLAVLLAPKYTCVNCIAPSAVIESFNDGGEFLKKFEEHVPMKRGVMVDDIYKAVNMLLDNYSITGQNIVIDGGYSLW